MSYGWFDWTSWVFGLVGLIYIIFSEERLRRERRTLRRVANEFEPSVAPVTTEARESSTARGSSGGSGSPAADDRIRSVLIQAAVDQLPFRIVLDRARRFGSSPEAVEQLALRLRDTKLLKFDTPLVDTTIIKLT